MRQRKLRIIIDVTTNLSFKDIKSAYTIKMYSLPKEEKVFESPLIGTITYPNIHRIEVDAMKKKKLE